MSKYILCAIGAFINLFTGWCYNTLSQGSVTDAMAGFKATYAGIWQVGGNQAAIAELNAPVLSFFYRQRYMLAELSDKSFAFVYPSKLAHVGLLCHFFGNRSYRETQVGLSTARKFGNNFSVGLKFSRYSTYMNHKFNQRVQYNVDAGIISKLSERVTMGCYIQSMIPRNTRQGETNILATFMGLGIAFTIHPRVSLMSEIQSSDFPNYAWVGAVHIKASECFDIYSGLSIPDYYSYSFSFGFSYSINTYEMGLALVQHSQLGITPSFQLSYRFARR